jgi:acyl phosphate:glycerol-3-phosphate acyltransferase
MSVLIAFAVGYLMGSIPFGLLLTRAAGLGDVRQIGSGNIGATNVLRTGNKALAAATLFLDGFKGFLAVMLVWYFAGPSLVSVPQAGDGERLVNMAAFGAFIGHIFPVWLNFKGGKGVATFIGVLFALTWKGALAFCAIWLVVALLTRYSSLAALIASAAMPLIVLQLGLPAIATLLLVMTALLFWTHRENISRLIAGTEGRIGGAKAKAEKR